MSTHLTAEEQRERAELTAGAGGREDQLAPSVLSEEEPTVARTIGFLGAAAVLVGGVVLISRALGRDVLMGSGTASVSLALGLAALLFHAAFDRDVQFRRLYMAFGYLALAVGAFLSVLPYPTAAGDLFGPGFSLMVIALLFLLAFLRHETEPAVRNFALAVVGGAGAIMAVLGLLGGQIKAEFLMPFGLLLGMLGLVYLMSFVAVRGTSDDVAYRAGLALGLLGVLTLTVALLRSAWPALYAAVKKSGPPPADFLVQGGGFLLMLLGLLYAAVAAGTCSDRQLVVLTRRELMSFFYSPIAYFVLIVYTLLAGINFFFYLGTIQRQPMPEPIVRFYVVDLIAVFSVIIGVPVLTMRLFSEESRTGTLEVLLTAPVEDTTVVLGKFLAALVMYLVLWLPFGLLLVALRLGGDPFDYRPLLVFLIGLIASGAGFVALGLMFSAVTRNQIAAAVLTFVTLMGFTFVYIGKYQFFGREPEGVGATILTHLSYLDLWLNTLHGKLQPNLLLFHVSLAVVCLFVTVKWLESRRWR